MLKYKMSQKFLDEKYKEMKVSFAHKFLRIYINILSVLLPSWLVFSLLLYQNPVTENIVCLVLILFTLTVKFYYRNKEFSYVLGLVYLWLIDFKCIYLAF